LLLGFGRARARDEERLVFGLAVEKVVEHGFAGLIFNRLSLRCARKDS
jgi:hypothetical protein